MDWVQGRLGLDLEITPEIATSACASREIITFRNGQTSLFTENMARIPLTNLFLKCLQIMAESQLPTKNITVLTTEKIKYKQTPEGL